MRAPFSILVINVGSTSTKVAVYKNTEPIVTETIKYGAEELASYATLQDQLPRREQDLTEFLQKHAIGLTSLDIVISRGGLGKPGPAGAYEINDLMCEDLLTGKYGIHPSALGPAMALDIKRNNHIPAIVMDPPSTDEFESIARFSGIPDIERKSAFHALNQKAAARRAASDIGTPYERLNLIVAHLGGGITIGAHRQGRVVDCTHGLNEGPFTPERAGALPSLDLVGLAFSGMFDKGQLQVRLVGRGGLAAYLGTTDAQQIEAMINKGDEHALTVYRAMAYQIAKDIGAMAAVLKGPADAIVLTGGLAQSVMLTDWVDEWIHAIAPVYIYPGEDEMLSMAEGAVRVLREESTIMQYG
jgi:butyrate kinase